MDEDFMLWNFLEEERERYANQENGDLNEAQREYVEDDDDDEMDEEDMEKLMQALGQELLRQGGNY